MGTTRVGDLTFPESAKWADAFPRFNEWSAQWLLDQPIGRDIPPVVYYTMGELPAGNAPGNEWRTAPSWPPPSRPLAMYLTVGGALQSDIVADGGQRTFTYDPHNPVPTHGGPNLLIPAGSFDQRDTEQRDDVLVFTSDLLANPLEVTGRLRAILHVTTTAVDTDFTAKLTDVYPDGRSMLLVDGICRLSLRESLEHRSEVTPGETYRLAVDLWSTSYVFNQGHRICLAISSSNSPRFEPNPNTGEISGSEKEAVTATQTLLVGGEHPSHLLLPVIDSR